MISSEGKFRNGKKFTELAYLLPISRNSGVLKRMASRECIGIPLIRPTATESMRRMVGPQFSDLLQAGRLWVVGYFFKGCWRHSCARVNISRPTYLPLSSQFNLSSSLLAVISLENTQYADTYLLFLCVFFVGPQNTDTQIHR